MNIIQLVFMMIGIVVFSFFGIRSLQRHLEFKKITTYDILERKK